MVGNIDGAQLTVTRVVSFLGRVLGKERELHLPPKS
jgi:hypothetical protein